LSISGKRPFVVVYLFERQLRYYVGKYEKDRSSEKIDEGVGEAASPQIGAIHSECLIGIWFYGFVLFE
jgi:hypothetical protein